MILIDKDEVNEEYYKNPSYLNLCKAINNAKIIDAIPVEWIAEWVTTHTKFSWSRMLHDWRAERKEK